MYIAPNTVIKILHNCPLSNNYNHTIYFADRNSQYAYFNSLTKWTLPQQSYQRVNKGVMRVAYKAEDLYDCNYLMFQNTSFGSKWFYAFITSVEYVNNITSEITFEIDIMQTWFWDCSMKPCFVVREHSVDDSYGGNLVPEKLAIGEYEQGEFTGTNLFTDWKIVLVRSSNAVGVPYRGGFYSKIYQQAEFKSYTPNEDGVNSLLVDLQAVDLFNNDGSILSLMMMPDRFISEEDENIEASTTKTVPFSINKELHVGNYTPRNKKLLCYPYNFLSVSNLQGDNAEFHYELFTQDKAYFRVICDTSVDPTAILVPQYYRVAEEGGNLYERLVLKGFPKCAYTLNNFAERVLQGAAVAALTALSVGAGVAAVAGGGGAVAASAGTQALPASTAVSTQVATHAGKNAYLEMGKSMLKSTATGVLTEMAGNSSAPYFRNVSGDSNALIGIDKFDFIFSNTHITREFAERIDSYFDMYGYATNLVKVPNINSRPVWNYVQTEGCIVTGNVPADVLSTISDIFDHGITFWKNGSQLGNYGLADSNKV